MNFLMNIATKKPNINMYLMNNQITAEYSTIPVAFIRILFTLCYVRVSDILLSIT